MGKEEEIDMQEDSSPRERRKISGDNLKKVGKEIKEDIKKAIDKGKEIWHEKRDALKNKIKTNKDLRKIAKRINKIQKVDENTDYLKLYDRFTFSYGLISIFTAFVLTFYPDVRFMAYFMVFKNFIMLLYRFWDWKPKKWHYFYFDFCYWCNFLSWFFVLVKPKSKFVFIMLFFNAMSPMLNYFVILRSKLIFQNANSITSFMMHFIPGLFVFRVRFYNNEADSPYPLSSEFDTMVANSTWTDQLGYFLTGLLYYSAWCLGYYIVVFILLKNRIAKKGNMTMYDYLVNDIKHFNFIIFYFGKKVSKITYSFMHLLQGILGCMMSLIFFNSLIASVIGIYVYCLFPVWYGSLYYFDYFSRDYVGKLERRAETNKAKRKRKREEGKSSMVSSSSLSEEEEEEEYSNISVDNSQKTY